MNTPQNRFSGAPAYDTRTAIAPAGPARVVEGGGFVSSARVSLPREAATVTVYADGFSCLNARASAIVALFEKASLCLHAPVPVQAGRAPKLWELSAGSCAALSAHPEKPAQLRFRVPPAEGPAPGRYLLLPVPGESKRFTLMPA